ncbi:MAG: hypothetical protein ACREPQ_01415 [Rhodanobacter sp.]
MFSPLIHRLQKLCLPANTATISRRWLQLAPAWLARSLPALSSVLYEPMQPSGAATWELPRGLLVESMPLVPLLQGRRLAAVSTITVEGPREWIECVDGDDRLRARLHLLPDTDYLAWDALLDRAEPASAPTSTGWSYACPAAGAQLLRFHLRRLAGLDVLGGEVVVRVSPLSRQLAGQIARVETRAWRPAANG